MINRLRQLFGRFKADQRGNVAMVFALSATALMAAVGGGVDYSRSTAIGTKLQAALDSGTLAAASLTQTRSSEDVVRAYVEAALADQQGLIDSLVLDVTSTERFNSREVHATAHLSVKTSILGLAGINVLGVTRSSDAIEQIRDIEISLVLDISGSMNGSKIVAMRDAAEEFVNVVMADNPERTSLSLIPYNGGVRLPPEVLNAGLASLPINQRSQSACLDHGNQYPIQIPLIGIQLPLLTWDGRDMIGSQRSSHCPESDEASIFLSNNRQDLISRIRRLDAGGNTGLDVATAWGARALDPAWRGRLGGTFASRPAAYTAEDQIKVLVVMTDGAATAQSRRYWDTNRSRWRTRRLYSASRARRNMGDACDAAESNGVHIYTIAFQLNGNTNRNLMRNCASAPDNYFQVEDSNIASAFSAIAADINELRLSR